jgi:hypothetical protein
MPPEVRGRNVIQSRRSAEGNPNVRRYPRNDSGNPANKWFNLYNARRLQTSLSGKGATEQLACARETAKGDSPRVQTITVQQRYKRPSKTIDLTPMRSTATGDGKHLHSLHPGVIVWQATQRRHLDRYGMRSVEVMHTQKCSGHRRPSQNDVSRLPERASGGDAFLDTGFIAEGNGNLSAVRLLGARVGRRLSMRGATLRNPTGPALAADRMQTIRSLPS